MHVKNIKIISRDITAITQSARPLFPVIGVNVRTIARMRAMKKSRRKPPPLLVSRLSETFEEHAELYGTNEMFLSALN